MQPNVPINDMALRDLCLNMSLRFHLVPNFILFQSPAPLYDGLLERGFVIRRCANFRGLDEMWYRIAVRAHEDNERLLAAMREVLS